jgi:hypothetical protein
MPARTPSAQRFNVVNVNESMDKEWIGAFI